MKALGTVPVGSPVNIAGEATVDHKAMVGIAGRTSGMSSKYHEGEEFPLITDKECLITLIGPMEFMIGSILYRLNAFDYNYVTIRGGKIVDFQGRIHNG